jgi:hypothetical protein
MTVVRIEKRDAFLKRRIYDTLRQVFDTYHIGMIRLQLHKLRRQTLIDRRARSFVRRLVRILEGAAFGCLLRLFHLKQPLARLLTVDEVPTDKPIVTLDVDGVLNAYDHGREPSPWQPKVEDNPMPYAIDMDEVIALPYRPSGAYGHVSKREYRIQWSRDLMGAIADAADAGKATFVWLTSWDDEAGLLADELLWPGRPSPVLGYLDSKAGMPQTTFDSKRTVMAELCRAMEKSRPDDPMPIISFDDDQPWNDLMWGTGIEFPKFFHGIGTDPRNGITQSQWDTATNIAEGASDEAC